MQKQQATKVQLQSFLKTKLSTDSVWAAKALVTIYAKQTSYEQANNTTSQFNGVGFNGTDAYILSSFAKQVLTKKYLSVNQMNILFAKIPKYWKQILTIAEADPAKFEKLNDMVLSTVRV